MILRALIVDDEPHATETVRGLCATVTPHIEVAAVAHWMEDARKMLEEEKPDIIFLDIELKDGCGLDLIPDFRKIAGTGSVVPVVLFSSVNLSASKAFDLGVLDFLEKPVTVERFAACHDRMLTYFKEQRQFIPIDTKSGREFLTTDDIAVIAVTVAGGSWTSCQTSSGRIIKNITKTILEWEAVLPEHRFFRVSRSQMIAFAHVEGELKKLSNGTGEFSVGGQCYHCSRSRCLEFQEKLSKVRS